jgi:hypothetical protein
MRSVFLILAMLSSACAHAEVSRIAIRDVAPAFGGRSFGKVGEYERITAIAHFRVDPSHPLNADITYIRNAPRSADDHVEFDSDVVIYRPKNSQQASGRLIYEPVNRGTSLLFGTFNNANTRDASKPEAAGDGWLMERGHTIVISGWQADYPVAASSAMNIALASRLIRAPGSSALGARLPIAKRSDGGDVVGLTREQLSESGTGPTFVANLAYPAASLDQATKLTVREKDEDPRLTPPGLSWKLIDPWRVEITKPTDQPPTAGAIYEFVYTAKDPIVYGLGLASMRDLVSFLRYESGASNPLAANGTSTIRSALGFGASQTGRTMKELVHEFNEDERGRIVFDGVQINISGAGKNAVDSPFSRPGQKDAQHGPSRLRGDEFPFSYAVTYDPLSRRTDGVLARCQGTNTCPKIMHVDSENELWHGGTLTYVDANSKDLPIPSNVRVFAFAGTEHSASATTAPPICQVTESAAIDWRPMNRALFAALEEWVAGRAPPSSRFPSMSNGQLATAEQTSVGFPKIPGIKYSGVLDARYVLDFSEEPPFAGSPYPRLAPKVDADGTMIGGVRHPFVAAPLATHTGWNLRRAGFGEDELCVASGMRIPFARTKAEREAKGDPRLAIEERYGSERDYVDAVKAAAEKLVRDRLLLRQDANAIIVQAGERYREATQPAKRPK